MARAHTPREFRILMSWIIKRFVVKRQASTLRIRLNISLQDRRKQVGPPSIDKQARSEARPAHPSLDQQVERLV